jgi:hypothetical protein
MIYQDIYLGNTGMIYQEKYPGTLDDKSGHIPGKPEYIRTYIWETLA